MDRRSKRRPPVTRSQVNRGTAAEAPEPVGRPSHRIVTAVSAVLVLLIVAVFAQTAQFGFVNFDDRIYVLESKPVLGGLASPRALGWAFTALEANNWHPLTWLSHMLDVQCYGIQWPGGHHLTNVAIHAITAVLLLLVIRNMTGRVWPAAFVASVFAVHPLRVESVAWVAERKDVLSGLFFVLTLAAYLAYVRRRFSWMRYASVIVLFALGLMAKPMLVTLPFVLLLLDYWPLGRWSIAPATGADKDSCVSSWLLVAEKIPLFVLVSASCVMTTIAQGDAIAPLDNVRLTWRLSNAAAAAAAYIGQLFCPVGLAAFYPHPGNNISIAKVVVSLFVVAGVSLGAWICRKRFPYWIVGWFWYLGMLVPVIGLLQVGSHAMADRYTYLPQIGLCWALTWGIADLTSRWPHHRFVCGTAATLAVAAMTASAWRQTTYWNDSETLWKRALACTVRNLPAHINLGAELCQKKDLDGATAHYHEALRIDPNQPIANNNIGLNLAAQGQARAALAYYQKALAVQPNYADAHRNMGRAYLELNNIGDAISCFQRALEFKSDDAATHADLGRALGRHGDHRAAIKEYETALELDPTLVAAHYNMGLAYVALRQPDAAIRCYRRALEIEPNHFESMNNWGSALARQGKLDEAIPHFRDSLAADPKYLPARQNLVAALGQQGKIAEAVEQLREAVRLQPDQVNELRQLAWALATSTDPSVRNGAEAVRLARHAVQLGGERDARLLDTLAAAYAEAGQFTQSTEAGHKALQIARQGKDLELIETIRGHVLLYESRSAIRELKAPPW